MSILLEPRFCGVDRCRRLHHAHGVCSMHYQRQLRTGSYELKRTPQRGPCQALGCLESARVKGRCRKHYLRMWLRAKAAASATGESK